MSTVKEIEAAIKELPRVEFMALANVIAAHQAALWEEEPEIADQEAGKLDFLYESEEEEQFEEKEDFEFASY